METFTGLGFRRDFGEDFLSQNALRPAFLEVAPENWMNMGGYWKKVFDKLAEKYKITTHGLSLSIGSPDPLDVSFIKRVKEFLDRYEVEVYSEHLSYSQVENAHLYDLLPIPFTPDAVDHIVSRIQVVQDLLARPLVLENVSYYTPVAAQMSEADFINEIVKKSGCKLLLDVNNVYVNAFNHQYDAKEFIQKMPLQQVAYIHMAGHEHVADDLIIDTHGQDIIDPVYELFDFTLERLNPVPVLLERDFNIPSFDQLAAELNQLNEIAAKHWSHVEAR